MASVSQEDRVTILSMLYDGMRVAYIAETMHYSDETIYRMKRDLHGTTKPNTQQILKLLNDGYMPSAIAKRLGISTDAVYVCRKRHPDDWDTPVNIIAKLRMEINALNTELDDFAVDNKNLSDELHNLKQEKNEHKDA